MTYGRSILEDLRLAEEVGMVFPEAVVEEAEAEVDELGALNTAQLRTSRGKSLGHHSPLLPHVQERFWPLNLG